VIAFPLAHAGHWIVSLLYVLPLVVIAAVATVVTIRERRRGTDPDAPTSSSDDESEVSRRNS
jgi:cytochrome c-type biogenesis protein CcmH/NrfF